MVYLYPSLHMYRIRAGLPGLRPPCRRLTFCFPLNLSSQQHTQHATRHTSSPKDPNRRTPNKVRAHSMLTATVSSEGPLSLSGGTVYFPGRATQTIVVRYTFQIVVSIQGADRHDRQNKGRMPIMSSCPSKTNDCRNRRWVQYNKQTYHAVCPKASIMHMPPPAPPRPPAHLLGRRALLVLEMPPREATIPQVPRVVVNSDAAFSARLFPAVRAWSRLHRLHGSSGIFSLPSSAGNSHAGGGARHERRLLEATSSSRRRTKWRGSGSGSRRSCCCADCQRRT